MLKTILVISGYFYVLFKLEGSWRGAGGKPVRCPPVTLSSVLLAPDPPACWLTLSGKAFPPGQRHPQQANGSMTLPHIKVLKQNKTITILNKAESARKKSGRAAGLAVKRHFFI